METTLGGTVVFTQDELNSAVANATAMAKDATVASVLEDVQIIFRGEAREGNLTRDYATGLFNTIAEKVGGSTITSIGGLYTVEVSYDGDIVLTVDDVEADDEDDACEVVREGLSVEDVTLNFTVSYDGNSEQVETAYDRSWTIESNLDLSAEEQD